MIDELRKALMDKGIAFGFQEAAEVARMMGSEDIADVLRSEGIRRYDALPPALRISYRDRWRPRWVPHLIWRLYRWIVR